MKPFQQTQIEFIEHLKNPDLNQFDHGIEDRRLKIYRELFFNNVLGFLSSGFPVLESLYSELQWQTLARQFFAEHQCRSPYFIDISKEFVEYLSSEYQLTDDDPAFMQELAHYEWLELDLSVRKTELQVEPWDGESLVSKVQFSELASLVSYQFPVHQISPDFQPAKPAESVYIVVYRNSDDQVNFTLVTPVTAHLISVIQENESIEVQTLIELMIEALPQLEPQQICDSLQPVLHQLLSQQVLLPAS